MELWESENAIGRWCLPQQFGGAHTLGFCCSSKINSKSYHCGQYPLQILLRGCRSAADTSSSFLLYPNAVELVIDEFCTGCKVLKFSCAPVDWECPTCIFSAYSGFPFPIFLWDVLIVKWKHSFSDICAECGSWGAGKSFTVAQLEWAV